MPSWQSEFKAQLVGALAGDATLTALLASSQAIFQRRPDQGAVFPCLVYELEAEYGQRLNAPGKRVARVKIAAWADDPDALDAIEEALRALLDDQPARLTTTHWRCGRCRLARSSRQDGAVFDPDSQQPVARMTSEWEMWLYAR